MPSIKSKDTILISNSKKLKRFEFIFFRGLVEHLQFILSQYFHG
jgi:hypothetical protein